MSQVPGVGKRKAQRLLVELEGVFTKDAELRSLVGLQNPAETLSGGSSTSVVAGVDHEALEALLSMGFTEQEAKLALDGREEAGATTIEQALSFALKRLGRKA
jgi:Holliday junction DNA helicase RuvA